jgi:hypothetical protein
MNSRVYIELEWEKYFEPLYGMPIVLPPNTLLWRGYDTRYNSIPDRYGYFSSAAIAHEYGSLPNRDVGCFATTRPLKILDIRFMKSLLMRIIQTNKNDKFISDFAHTIISFGLCSLGHQILLVKQLFQDLLKRDTAESRFVKRVINKMYSEWAKDALVELEGIRIAETTNDGRTMAFLQELFRGHFDGFVSPRLKTPFHVEKGGILNPELILFNQKHSDIVMLPAYPSSIINMGFSNFMEDKHELIDITMYRGANSISMKSYIGGARGLDTIDDGLNSGDKDIVSQYNKAVKAGKKWRNKICIINPDRCSPPVPVNAFTHDMTLAGVRHGEL